MIAASMMVLGVIVDANEFKIFKSIVRLDFISVVNVLEFLQTPAKMPSHDNAMLKLEGIPNSDGHVSIRANKPAGVLHASTAFH